MSIRHGGTSIGEDNEINGLTLGGVGTGTTITNVEVIGNQDDGIEFFGGTVNASNLLVWGQGDDGLDIDQSYSGTISNAIVIANSTSDHGLEIDGPEGSMEGSFKMDPAARRHRDERSARNRGSGRGREWYHASNREIRRRVAVAARRLRVPECGRRRA